MQVVSIICDSTKPIGICMTGFSTLEALQGSLDATDRIPCGACYGLEHRSVYTGELQIVRSSFQRVATRGMQ